MTMLERRLARDLLSNQEVRRQAEELNLAIIEIDGRTSSEVLAAELAYRFRPCHGLSPRSWGAEIPCHRRCLS